MFSNFLPAFGIENTKSQYFCTDTKVFIFSFYWNFVFDTQEIILNIFSLAGHREIFSIFVRTDSSAVQEDLGTV